MIKSTLIVFEGIDNSGKTSISQGVQKMLMADHLNLLKEYTKREGNATLENYVHTNGSWVWSKEPDFSTQEADRLNDTSKPMDEVEREILFLESRLRQLPKYHSNSTILDRYLWTGMAYAKVFSNSTFPFVSKLYQSHNIFKAPALTIFVDTPVEVCQQREPDLTLERLNKIRDAYLETEQFVQGPIHRISGEGSLEDNVKAAWEIIRVELEKGLRGELLGQYPWNFEG
jgi:thymidylate kinase